jgi:tetratricopeptide (TPR) repeat protein
VQPNERLRHHRLQRGWTQENEAEELAALAPALGEKHLPVTGRMVGKWERGEATPKGVYRRGLCLLFGATAEELGLYQPPEKGIEDMQRRAFLQGLGVLTGFAVASSFTYEPWERLSAALAQPRRLDDTAMRDLEAVTASLESQYATVAPVTLTGAVQGHLATVTQLLDGHPPAQLERRLYSLAGEVAGLAGWLSADMGQHDRALIYFDNGIKAAQEANDRALGAYLLGSVTTLPAFREHSPQATLHVLREETRGFRARDATPTTRAWLASLEAEASAMRGDASGALDALESSQAAIESTEEADRVRPIVSFFDQARLAGEQGLCYVRLRRFDDAKAAFKTGLTRLDASSKIRARLLTGLATVHVRQQEIEQACRAAGEAWRIATRTRTALSLQQVHDVRRQLERWQDSRAVRELDELLRLGG